jgi:hypothetical protein
MAWNVYADRILAEQRIDQYLREAARDRLVRAAAAQPAIERRRPVRRQRRDAIFDALPAPWLALRRLLRSP